jgi:hypothetical protein
VNFIINPGAGPVEGATRENAEANMRQLLADANAANGTFELVRADSNGRFKFTAKLGEHECEVDMPGLPLNQVRSDDLLRIPRLYVNGSSWFWGYAVGFVGDALHGVEDGE